ncbi:SusC/RagA family TonB-linked outer membrane protein [Solitalea canadensis]|uniref:TonB-linked outer membrane protein, SusC/RagA family n=1 Tax=Solitalea canadensis (strain ATCC 29591 / DSM 3403 / JCM 21819 / LMG 8368 / NBRC 15130 / NCIMB 12057 / USAM 9D) TaxID=929556 RepID=H8KT85_SOLCM|nr:TonB-dependent receptor [Solitalea canadensis]AFD05268.1 TonB-linked outer membrane protein, SusC/RagA family [Solitalea canadensis DSM 3403]
MRRLFTNFLAGIFLCFIFLNTVTAQSVVKVKGRVTDEIGIGLPAVSVTVKGTSRGTQTTVDGDYSIEVEEGKTLVFSFLGFQTKEVTIKQQTVVNIQLNEVQTVLNQVVVVGYGTQKKRDLTGSITSIKGSEIAKQPLTNPISSLQGKVAGLTIVNNGSAGASPTVRIRGVNSTGNSDPLYVVDGVFQSNIDYLNPADIETIEVLRDPSSIAIFGLQGGNGVIIVTTKRAPNGETRVTFHSTVGMQRLTNKIGITDAAGFKKLYTAQLVNLGAAPFDYTNYSADTKWQDMIFQDALINTNSLSFSNNGEKTTTYLNLGYSTQNGVLKYNNYQKYNVRLNEEIKLNRNLKIGGDITGFYWNQSAPAADINNALWAAPIVPAQEDENTYYSMPSFQRAQVGNPLARLNGGTDNNINNGYRAIGNLFGEIKFLEKFTWKSSVNTDLGFNSSRGYSPLPYQYINLGENSNATTTTFDQSVRTGVNQSKAEYRKFQQDHTLSYNTTLDNSHKLTALAGFSTLNISRDDVWGNRSDTTLSVPRERDFWYVGAVNAANPGSYGGGGGVEAYMSLLGRVSYSYKDKYLVNVSYRRDGASKFAPENRWGNFGSLGLGWVASEEGFLKKLKGIDFLKFRASWGTVGNAMSAPAFAYLPGLTNAGVGVFGDHVYTSVAPSYIPDPNLHWEKVRGIDIGVDLRTLSNRLSAEVTLYDRKTSDLLTYITLPNSTQSYFTNLGSIDNRGVEISLSWEDKIGSDFTYSINPNFSYNKNEVESIGNDINFQLIGNGGINLTETGRSVGYFYGYKQVGIYQTAADLAKMPHMQNSQPGDIAYEDINGDGVITNKDRTYLGTPFPTMNYGLNLSCSYKNFDAMIEGQGVAGNKVYTQRRTSTFAVLNYESNRLNAWNGPGTSNVEPILDNTRANNYLPSTYYLESGDYLRLRTLQIGYTLGPEKLSRIGLQRLRVFVSGQNIKTWSKTTGYTPEAPISDVLGGGADNGTYPLPAIYSLGVNVTF